MTVAGRRFIERSLVLSSVVSRAYAIVMSCLSLRYRVGVCLIRHVDSSARVIGWRHIELGRNVAISAGSWLNVNARHGATKRLVIGDNCFIGRNNFVSVGKSVVIGPYCLTTSACSFIGATHFADPVRPYIATGVSVDAEIVIGANCFFGYAASVLGDVRIGHGCVIGAHTVVRSNIPPFSLVVGNPARVVKRFDFHTGRWRDDWEQIELGHPAEQDYVSSLRSSHRWPLLPISAATSGPGDI